MVRAARRGRSQRPAPRRVAKRGRPPGGAAVARGAGAGLLAGLLAAVQLLPTLEAGQWSARRDAVEASGSLIVGLQTALALLGPSLSYAAPQSWERQGVFGLYWLVAAVAAPVLGGG